MDKLKPYLGRLICTALGLIVAILFMVIGFWKTILILLCCVVGYAIGLNHDKGVVLPKWIFFWRNKF